MHTKPGDASDNPHSRKWRFTTGELRVRLWCQKDCGILRTGFNSSKLRAMDCVDSAGMRAEADSRRDPSNHDVQFVSVEDGVQLVQLEVLDWG